MGQSSDRRLLIRWAFLGMGYILLFGRFYAYPLIMFLPDVWATLNGGDGSGNRTGRMIAGLYMLLAAILCFAANSGLRRNKPWGRWAGMAACIISLPFFPFMTILGALGLYFLSTLSKPAPSPVDSAFDIDPATARRCKDYWVSQRGASLPPLIVVVVSIAALVSYSFWQQWAIRAGMASGAWGLLVWFWFPVFLLFNVVVHELGHSIVAWALYYSVRVICLGPMTVRHDSYGFHFQFDWRRLFLSGGFTGAVATRYENARWKHVAVVAGGPAASLLAGLVFAVLAVLAPSAGWQSWWWVFAANAILGFLSTVLNLIPLGYSDGSMLLHLIRWTTPGRLLISAQFASAEDEKARECHNKADFAGEIEMKRAMLAEAESYGDANAMTIAASHQTLGHALFAARDWPAAEQEFTRALAFEAELAADPRLAANVWSGLVAALARRRRLTEMRQAYTAAVAILRRRKESREAGHRGVICAMLAEVHAGVGEWDEAAAEASEGLKCVPLRPERLYLYANLFILQAEAYFRSGFADAGRTAASNAAETLRAEVMPAGQRNLAAREFGELGEALWRAGQTDYAIEYIRDAIGPLERAGLTSVAAAYRISLCGILRTFGRFSEAVKSLPPEDGLPAHLRRSLQAETIELAILAEAGPVALEHSQTLMQLWKAETVDCTIELAEAESLLARSYLACHKPEEAETHAKAAFAVLDRSGHPEAGRCLLTIAAARHAATGAWPSDVLDQARSLIEAAVLMPAVERERWLELAKPKEAPETVAVAVSAGD
jgi:Zn-dependent protease